MNPNVSFSARIMKIPHFKLILFFLIIEAFFLYCKIFTRHAEKKQSISHIRSCFPQKGALIYAKRKRARPVSLHVAVPHRSRKCINKIRCSHFQNKRINGKSTYLLLIRQFYHVIMRNCLRFRLFPFFTARPKAK